MGFATIADAIHAIRRGEMVVVADDEDRENEGDLVLAAEHATPEAMAFFVRHTSGLICTAITAERAAALELALMVARNTESQRTAFTVTVDYRHGTTTGISAADRARTVRALAEEATQPDDFSRPGHVAPLIACDGGVLRRAGHTEAAVDLARLAGLAPVGVLCELVTDDSLGMRRGADLEAFAADHGLVLVSIADLIRHRRRTERLVEALPGARMPTEWGDFTCLPYRSTLGGETHLALVRGEVAGAADVLVRVHSECLTGDVFGSRRCDCGEQLDTSMTMVAAEGRGVVVYLRGHEGRGIGIAQKLAAYRLQEQGYDTVDANLRLGLPVDSREYGVGAQILSDLGVTTMRLLTNNPAKRGGLEGFGLTVTAVVPLLTAPTSENLAYLRSKQARLGHLLGTLEDVG